LTASAKSWHCVGICGESIPTLPATCAGGERSSPNLMELDSSDGSNSALGLLILALPLPCDIGRSYPGLYNGAWGVIFGSPSMEVTTC
jgi:hypothetical protein